MPVRFAPELFGSIAGRLLKLIFASYFVVTVIVTCVQITLEYRETESRLLRTVEDMEQTFGPAINNAVWNINYAGLHGILGGMQQQPIVIGVKVVNAGGDVISAVGTVQDDTGKRFSANAEQKLSPILEQEAAFAKVLSRSFPVVFTDADGPKTIGQWTIYSSEKFVVEQVKFGFLLLLVNSVIKTVALWFIFFIVVRRLLGRPLQQLGAFVERLNIDNLGDEVFVLQDSGRHELHVLADKLNELQHKLKASVAENTLLFDQLRTEQAATQELNVTLEQRVDQRTAALAQSNQALTEAFQAAESARADLAVAIRRLQQTQSDLVESEKLASLGSLVAGVSHELNTPLGVALTMATALEHDASTFKKSVASGNLSRSALDSYLSRTLECGGVLVRSCERAASLITSFKQVAADQSSEQRRAFELLPLVQDILTTVRPSMLKVNWGIELAIPEGVQCDTYPGPLGQVIASLIQNAQHAFEGHPGGRLRISARVVESSVEVVVADDGKGMPPGTLAHIFDPFFTTRLGHGSNGLGLTICRNIAIAVLGGTLHATSAVGKGSEFVLTFPRNVAQRVERRHQKTRRSHD